MGMSNKPQVQQSGESGMTLIEVMVSTIVLGVVLVALGQALTLGIKMNTESKMRVSSLNACKLITENLKTQISQSQGVFDGTAASNSTYYVDEDGNRTNTDSASAFRVDVVVSDNNNLTQTVSGVTRVLVKALSVTVVDIQNISRTGRETSLKVEIIRPSA